MPHSHKPSAEERKYMHMSSVRMLNRDIEDLLGRAGINPLVGPDTIFGTGARTPINSKRSYILAEFYRCGNKLTAIPQRLYRARLVFQKGVPVPQIVREEILCLSDYQIGMLLGNNDAACYDVARLAKRIKIALKRFERTAILSVAVRRARLPDGQPHLAPRSGGALDAGDRGHPHRIALPHRGRALGTGARGHSKRIALPRRGQYETRTTKGGSAMPLVSLKINAQSFNVG